MHCFVLHWFALIRYSFGFVLYGFAFLVTFWFAAAALWTYLWNQHFFFLSLSTSSVSLIVLMLLLFFAVFFLSLQVLQDALVIGVYGDGGPVPGAVHSHTPCFFVSVWVLFLRVWLVVFPRWGWWHLQLVFLGPHPGGTFSFIWASDSNLCF